MSLRKHSHLFQPPTKASLEGLNDGVSQALAQELARDVDQLGRFTDLVASLEELKAIVQTIPSAQVSHLLLVENALNATLVGTPFAAETVMPSLETYQNTVISTEVLGSRIKDILVRILEFLRSIWRRVIGYFSAIAEDLSLQRMRFNHLSQLIDELSGSQPTTLRIRLGNDIFTLGTTQGPPSDGRHLNLSLDELFRQSQVIYDNYVPTVLAIGRELGPALRQWNPAADASEWLMTLNRVAGLYNVEAFKARVGHTSPLTDDRYPMGAAEFARPLPGMRSLVFMDGNRAREATDRATPEGQALAIQLSSVDLIRIQSVKEPDPVTAEMATMPLSMLEDMMRHVDKLLTSLSAQTSGGRRHELETVFRDLEAGITGIHSNQDEGLGALERGLHYVSAYQRWIKTQTEMFSLVYTVSRSALNVAARTVAAYR